MGGGVLLFAEGQISRTARLTVSWPTPRVAISESVKPRCLGPSLGANRLMWSRWRHQWSNTTPHEGLRRPGYVVPKALNLGLRRRRRGCAPAGSRPPSCSWPAVSPTRKSRSAPRSRCCCDAHDRARDTSERRLPGPADPVAQARAAVRRVVERLRPRRHSRPAGRAGGPTSWLAGGGLH